VPAAAEIARMARQGQEFTSPWTVGYMTRGGSYMLASRGRTNDSGLDRDLLIITAYGDVEQVSPTVNPEWAGQIVQAVEESKAVSR
ncbi:MAG: hypothetical protein L0K65_08755, partial [Actinomyces sp.]|nr:hypothetical protein [Actinomyces sp.]